MRLVFGTIPVVAGLVGTTILTRLLSRQTREFGIEGSLKLLRVVAMAVVPIGALMILSSGIRMISAGHVGVALLFGRFSPLLFTKASIS